MLPLRLSANGAGLIKGRRILPICEAVRQFVPKGICASHIGGGTPLKETEERPRVAERRKGMLSDAEPFRVSRGTAPCGCAIVP